MKNRYVWVFVLMFLAVACRAKPDEPLVFAVTPSEEAEVVRAAYAPLAEYLGVCVGREVNLLLVTDYTSVVMALKYNRVQLAKFGCAGYVSAARKAGAEAIAKGVNKPGEPGGYYSLIIARADSKITDLDGTSFAFVDPLSTSGYLAPALHLKEAGIKPREVIYAGGHEQAILAVQNGTVDAAGCSETYFRYAIEEGRIAEDEMEVIWRSNLIPRGPIAVPSGMQPALKAKLQECLVAVPQGIAEGIRAKVVGFVKATDSDYDEIRQMEELR